MSSLTPETIFRNHYGFIRNLALKILHDEDDADDVTQDVFAIVTKKLDSFTGASSIKTWLYRVTFNAAITHSNKKKSLAKKLMFVPSFSDKDLTQTRPINDAETFSLVAEEQEQIERAIKLLPSPYKKVYVLSELEDVPNADIASRMGISEAAVKSRLHRARSQMKKHLANYYEEN